MKLHHKIKRIIAVILIFCSILICTPMANAESSIISPKEALNLALLYYYGNHLENETVTIDSYFITPLYDNDENILHYCIDFFDGNEGKGYVIIAADVSYTICPEMTLEGNSEYYKNEKNGYNNIYYNPFEKFLSSKISSKRNQKHFDTNKQEISKSKVKGTPIKGDYIKNKRLKDSTNVSGAAAPSTLLYKAVFSEHPSVFLQNLGFSNISAYSYSTMESQMSAAGALNPMYNSYNSTISTVGVPLPGGTVLRNVDHCVITAIANVMMYWKSVCCPSYPASYNALFEEILLTADFLNVFPYDYVKTNSSDTSGYFPASYTDDVMIYTNYSYQYNGRVAVDNSGDWIFLTKYINDYTWPVIITFGSTPNFTYQKHAVVAFAYNSIRCEKGANAYVFRFAKVTDGWSTSSSWTTTPKYINWDMVENAGVSSKMFAFCPYGGPEL